MGVPSSASLRIGSAFLLMAAIAIGAVPMATTARAARAARERATYAGVARSHQRVDGHRAGCAGHRRLGVHGHPEAGHVPSREQEEHRQHRIGVGTRAAEESQVLDEHPVGHTEDSQGDEAHEDETPTPAQEQSADGEEREDDEQVHFPAVRLRRTSRTTSSHDEKTCGCGVCAMVWTIAERVPPRPCQ